MLTSLHKNSCLFQMQCYMEMELIFQARRKWRDFSRPILYVSHADIFRSVDKIA